MNESSVYVAVSNHLRHEGWELLGGQPPSGTDHLPVIEIKDPEYPGRGSKGSMKPDLIARKGQTILIVELKARFSTSDRQKLLDLLANPSKIQAFWSEIGQRDIKLRDGISIKQLSMIAKIEGALGFAGPVGELKGLWALRIKDTGAVVIECQ